MTHSETVHFVGVGGVGMSGIAAIASRLGMKVSGSDMKASRYTQQLVDAGVEVHIGHAAQNVPEDCDVVVASTAIPETNPEIIQARAAGIPVWQRAAMLAKLGEGKKTLAAAGTHGKTTTSSMLAQAIDALGLDPSFVVGGIVGHYGTNAGYGAGDYYVVEADESDGSFLRLSPYVALVTNVEADHLDHYTGGLAQIRQAFYDFMASVPDQGAVVVCAQDPSLVELAQSTGKRVVTYGFTQESQVRVSDYATKGVSSSFTVTFPDGTCIQAGLTKNPGMHNALNTAGVLAVVWALGYDVEVAAAGLRDYAGVARRFDMKGEADGVCVVDDYAHHPTEISATLTAAAGLDFKRVVVLFQPHRYSRTQSLVDSFATCFVGADKLVVMDVYGAGEAPIEGVSGKLIADAVDASGTVAEVDYVADFDATPQALLEILQPGDLLLTMGAGTVTTIGPKVLSGLARRGQE